MLEEDGLHEEATGLGRMLPHSITHRISSRISQSGEKTRFCCCGVLWWFLLTFFLPLPFLAIGMIFIGQVDAKDYSGFHAPCRYSWLSSWMVWSGGSILCFYALGTVFCVTYYITRHQGRPDDKSWPQTCTLLLMSLCLVLAGFWYLCGCRWTWKSVYALASNDRYPYNGTDDQGVYIWTDRQDRLRLKRVVEEACRENPALWFSLFLTILPLLYGLLFTCMVYKVAKRRRESSEEEEESHMMEA
eukprot:GFUD01021967.1.p1 GENE.GFUD01021967.1~~GFUD01021967.1.p1  ORF type:complete len:245 (-),score=38.99 GFUD01021967.1:87-821(-)